MQERRRQDPPRLIQAMNRCESQVLGDYALGENVAYPQSHTHANDCVGDDRGLCTDPDAPPLTRPGGAGASEKVASASARAVHTDRTDFRGDDTLGAHGPIATLAVIDAAHAGVARALGCSVGIRTLTVQRLRHINLPVCGHSVMSIDSITTSSTGRSLRPVRVVAIASTTRLDSSSITSPKMVWFPLSHGVGATVIKN